MIGKCLTDIEFEAYSEQPREAGERFQHHLSECVSCQTSWAALQDRESVAQRMRQAASASGTLSPLSYLSRGNLKFRSPSVPDKIAGYEILREIHRGGQGIVYEANQLATKRQVALKVLLEDSWSAPDYRRQLFEREIEYASNLNHPNIVSIYDSGLAEGHYYFAMEYVSGATLDEYVHTNRLTVSDVVRLFLPICDAVGYAHRHGIIHRDLKPVNIRVDERGQPKLLDFGLAENLNIGRNVAGQVLGTPAYLAPEHADAEPAVPDVRSDVYTLCVVLYELLAQRLPHDPSGTWSEVCNRIRTQPPQPIRAHNDRVSRDLEAVILKGLSKSQADRYQSAFDLEEDLRRGLTGQAVEARRHERTYVAGKAAERHKWLVSGIASIGLLVGWHVQSLSSERDRAMTAQQQEQEARLAAEQINDFLADTFISVNKPSALESGKPLLKDVLDNATQELSQSGFEPQVTATLRTTIGNAYRHLGEYDLAESHLNTALEEYENLGNTAAAAAGQNHLAMVLKEQGRLEEAEMLQRLALAYFEAVSDDVPGQVTNRNDLATILQQAGKHVESRALYEDALALGYEIQGLRELEIPTIENNLGTLLRVMGEHDDAESAFRDALSKLAESEQDAYALRATINNNLAGLLRTTQRYTEARPYYEEALALRTQYFGSDHLLVAQSQDNLAALLSAVGELGAAQELQHSALAIREKVLGSEHLEVAASLNNLATSAYYAGNFEEAETLSRQALHIHQATLGNRHPKTAVNLRNLGTFLYAQERFGEADPVLEQALNIQRDVLGSEHVACAITLMNLAANKKASGKRQPGLALQSEAVEILRKTLGKGLRLADALYGLASSLSDLDRLVDAEHAALEASDIYASDPVNGSAGHKRTLQLLINIAERRNDVDGAEEYRILLNPVIGP